MSAQSVLERLAATVLRHAVTGGLSDDPLLIVAGQALEALRAAADGEISTEAAKTKLDALADHADAQERRALLKAHRGPLLAMGVISGFMGAVSSLVWALGMFALIFAPLILIVSVWLYTLVFAFASAWFAHYMLAALQALRAVPEAPVLDLPPAPPPVPLLPTP